MKKTDYLGLNLAEETDTVDFEKFFNDNPKVLDTKIKSMDTDITSLKPLLTAPTILTPTLYNGWAASSPTTYPLKYWKMPDGTVHFRLAVKNGAKTSENAITILPAGYRPAASEMQIGHVDNGGTDEAVIFEVKTNGNIQSVRTLPNNTLVVINGSFKAV